MKSKKIKYIKQPNTLKMKAGHGGIPQELIKRAQDAINNTSLNFEPEAKKFIDTLQAARKKAQAHHKTSKAPLTEINNILLPIMQLKANGGMFQYQLISDVADICLQFLEAIDSYDKESIEIVRAHERTIIVILENKLKGDGNEEGYKLVIELHKACQRYFNKQPL